MTPISPHANRREFLSTSAAAAAAITLRGPTVLPAASPSRIKIEEPFPGAVLNRRHGTLVDGGLAIRVTGTAQGAGPVTVNGRPAQRQGERFSAEIVLRQHETDITAALGQRSAPEETTVRVVWDRHSFPRYRFSIDDNSFFLRDVAHKGYRSLFDCFYLQILRDLNAKYGAKFVCNIYYTTGDGFNITQFPDRYRGEWKDNAHWLRLAFHAYADKPDRPYEDAPVEKLLADFDLVSGEIKRFAGEETFSVPTVIHWAMTRPEAWKALYDRGVRVLSGFFRKAGNRHDINYRMDEVRSQWLSRHDALKDFPSGIVFSRVDIVCNNTPVDQTIATLEPLTRDPSTAEIMDLFTHEQYFWPFYVRHVPDHAQRLDTAIRFVTERGYKPVFFHEGFLGAPAS